MTQYEYKVIPAPSKGRKAAGVKSAEARFALGLQEAMNGLAAEGWEYVRSDLLPSEERQGLTSSQTVYRSVLVFRRARPDNMPESGEEQMSITPHPPASAIETPDHVGPDINEALAGDPASEDNPLPPRLP